ncbi:MAG: pyridoxal-phosphate dependent enzyme, partial [Firmicutes bacterium]|nr:pyridoxal-phosphate dependent enzyme [Bacillota bacterium]
MANVLYCENPYRKTANAEGTAAERFGLPVAETALAFHKGFPEYAETPLVRLKQLATDLGLGALYIKDESARFGLNAFKVLGGSYAIARIVAEWIGQNAAGLSPAETAERLANLTFVTATDGNHGRGVAWAAKRFGAKCVVYLPKGSAAERLENIRALGADAEITDLSYDDCVRLAAKDAAENGRILVQDTAWP